MGCIYDGLGGMKVIFMIDEKTIGRIRLLFIVPVYFILLNIFYNCIICLLFESLVCRSIYLFARMSTNIIKLN